MKMSSSNRVIVAMLAVVALAVAFWMLLLSPKKDEVSKLDTQVAKQEESLALHRSEVDRGLAAREAFPVAYQQLVVLGKAAPADDDTASLLVQLNRIADRSKVRFETFVLAAAGGEEASAGIGARARTRCRADLSLADRGRRLDDAARRLDRPGRPRGNALHA